MAHGLLSTNLNLMFPLIPVTVGQSIALNCVLHWSEPGAYKSKPEFIPLPEISLRENMSIWGVILRKRTGNVSVSVPLVNVLE